MDKGLREVIAVGSSWLQDVIHAVGIVFNVIVDTMVLPIQLLLALLS